MSSKITPEFQKPCMTIGVMRLRVCAYDNPKTVPKPNGGKKDTVEARDVYKHEKMPMLLYELCFLPRINSCGNSPGVRWARANAAELMIIAIGVGTLKCETETKCS